MQVKGAGHLLVEDYRLKPARPGRAAGSNADLLLSVPPWLRSTTSAQPDRLQVDGPHEVSEQHQHRDLRQRRGMRHLSGPKMYELDRLAAAIGADPQRLRQLPGREASLNCDHFTVEFERDAAIEPGQPAPLSRATHLKGFKATGRQVRLEESGRFVEGIEVSFNSASQVGKVIGSAEFPAKLYYLDQRTGQPFSNVVDQFKWTRKRASSRCSGAERGTGR